MTPDVGSSLFDALLIWYSLSVLGWMLAALLRYRRQDIQAYLWCLIWPVGLIVNGD